MDQNRRARDMSQEVVTQPGAFGGALDQAGNVGHHERGPTPAADLNHAEIRLERRERVVGNLRCCTRGCGKQRRLAGVRQSDKSNVRDQPQLQPQGALFTRLAQLGDAWRLPHGCLEVDVAQPATAAAHNSEGFTNFGEIGNHLIGLVVPDDRAGRNLDDETRRRLAGHLPSQPLAASSCFEFLVVLKLDQAGDVRRDFEHYVAAAATVASVRSALGRVLLTTERHRAVAAVPGADKNSGAIDEHGW